MLTRRSFLTAASAGITTVALGDDIGISNGAKPAFISPIDCRHSECIKRPASELDLSFHYKVASAFTIERGHSLKLTAQDPGYVVFNGMRYIDKQRHIHYSSEHRIDGQKKAAEIHDFLSTADESRHLVIATMVVIGRYNTALEPLLTNIPKPHESIKVEEAFDPRSLIPEIVPCFSYEGGSTTDPTVRDVHFLVCETPISMTKQQQSVLEHATPPNAQKIQPLGNRKLIEYVPG